MPRRGRKRVAALQAFATLTVLAGAGLLALLPWRRFAEPLPGGAPPEVFSAHRAMEQLRWIAESPRPIGSAAAEKVRERLVAELTAAGLQVEVQRATVMEPPEPGLAVRAAAVENVLARLPGAAPSAAEEPALLVLAHYDSVPNSPGAGDDGSGVAALLEALRAVRAGPPLARDLLVLFTDGEEAGLFGARAFVRDHPWAHRVGLALNLDARGAAGPALMFRTGGANGWLVRQLAGAAPAPRASSLSYEVFRFMPNDTDLAVFLEAGIEGMDFAFIGDHPRYHSAADTVEHLSPASLQHAGEQLLALLRHFGDLDLAALPQGKAVYFNAFGDWMVVHPASWTPVLAGAALVLWVAVAVLAVRRRRATGGGILGAALGTLVIAVAAALLVAAAWQQASRLDSDFGGLPRALSYEASAYAAAFLLLALAEAFLLLLPLVRLSGGVAVGLGAGLLAALLALATALLAPGASYVFLWPLLPLLALMGVSLLAAKREDGGPEEAPARWGAWTLAALGALPLLFLWVPLVDLLLQALGLPLAAVAMPLVVFGLALAAPMIEPLVPWNGRLAALSFLAALAVLVPAVRSSSFDAEHPRADSLFYCLDPERGEALWATAEEAPAAWMEPVLGEDPQRASLERFLPGGSSGFLASEAAVVDLPAPELRLLRQEVGSDGVYRLAISIRSRRGAPMLAVAAESLASVQALSVDGRRVDLGEEPLGGFGEPFWLLRYFGAGDESLELELELNQLQAVEVQVVDLAPGLPETAPPRPPDSMPRPFVWQSDATLARSSAFF